MQPNPPPPPSPSPSSQPPQRPAQSPASGQAPQQIASKIQHSRPGIGSPAPTPAPAAAPAADAPNEAGAGISAAGAAKISMFGRERHHEQQWTRTPNTTGSGAIHVKSFSCKLTEDALQYMDQAINEWLDAHPQYEVKFVSSSIGTMTGKLKEPALICQVWV